MCGGDDKILWYITQRNVGRIQYINILKMLLCKILFKCKILMPFPDYYCMHCSPNRWYVNYISINVVRLGG